MAISKPELACVYAALILADDDIDVTVCIALVCFNSVVTSRRFLRARPCTDVRCLCVRGSRRLAENARPALFDSTLVVFLGSSVRFARGSVRIYASSRRRRRLECACPFRWPSTTIVATCSKTLSYSFRRAFLETV